MFTLFSSTKTTICFASNYLCLVDRENKKCKKKKRMRNKKPVVTIIGVRLSKPSFIFLSSYNHPSPTPSAPHLLPHHIFTAFLFSAYVFVVAVHSGNKTTTTTKNNPSFLSFFFFGNKNRQPDTITQRFQWFPTQQISSEPPTVKGVVECVNYNNLLLS